LKSHKIILGTVQFGLTYGINNNHGKPSDEEVFKVLQCASENGITILDTAEAYGNASELIGKFHINSSYRFDINTKFIFDKKNSILRQADSSRTKLNIDYINTFFFHDYNDFTLFPELLTDLKKLKETGIIKKTGISVYDNGQLQTAINNIDIDVIQLPFNLLDNHQKRGELLYLAKSRNKEIHIRSVFLQGLFFKDLSTFNDSIQSLIPYVLQLRKIADKHQISIENMALIYAMSKKYIDYIVIGVDNHQQLQKNMLYTESLLSEEAIKEIDAIDVKEAELLYPYNWK
jgi:aryl-alcohol dehydrogenase-like predicted oxidoreductase